MLLVDERDRAESRLRSAEQAKNAHRDAHAELVYLQRVRNTRFGHLIAELDAAPGSPLGQSQCGGVDVEVAPDRLHTAQHRLSIPRDHREGSEDMQALPAREAKPEIRTPQFVGAGLQHANPRRERHKSVLLVFGTGGDVEARQERLGVTTELSDELGVTPHGCGADQAAHSITCREMIKVCRELSRLVAASAAML